MSCFLPKRKTENGLENIKLSIASIEGLQHALDDLEIAKKHTADKLCYLAILDPESSEIFNSIPASVSVAHNGIQYDSFIEVTLDDNDSENTFAVPITTHIPLQPGENISFSQNSTGDAIVIEAAGGNLNMPIIRLGAVSDKNGTMVINNENPLTFSVEIIGGKLEVGDKVQICTRQLFTYNGGKKRKYRLRKVWETEITENNANSRFIPVSIFETPSTKAQRLFKTGTSSQDGSTLSALYIRVRRPIFNSKNEAEVDGLFSNIVTVWKKYHRGKGTVYIK